MSLLCCSAYHLCSVSVCFQQSHLSATHTALSLLQRRTKQEAVCSVLCIVLCSCAVCVQLTCPFCRCTECVLLVQRNLSVQLSRSCQGPVRGQSLLVHVCLSSSILCCLLPVLNCVLLDCCSIPVLSSARCTIQSACLCSLHSAVLSAAVFQCVLGVVRIISAGRS